MKKWVCLLVIILLFAAGNALAADVCTITFNDNGGSGGPGEARISVGDEDLEAVRNHLPVREGYQFTGYYDEHGRQAFAPNGLKTDGPYCSDGKWSFTGDVTLYAWWFPSGVGIADLQIIDISQNGYTIVFRVTNPEKLDRVQCPTWTVENGQDDLNPNWASDPSCSAQLMEDGSWCYRVNAADHFDETGDYTTHIYGFTPDGTFLLLDGWTITVRNYTLTFDDNEGSGGPGTVDVRPGMSDYCDITWGVPTRPGFTFAGYFDGDGQQVYDATGMCVNDTGYWSINCWVYDSGATLYAAWTRNVYTIKCFTNGGTTEQDVFEVSYGCENYCLIGSWVPVREGYRFDGYYLPDGTMLYDSDGRCVNDGAHWQGNIWYYEDNVFAEARWTELEPADVGGALKRFVLQLTDILSGN